MAKNGQKTRNFVKLRQKTRISTISAPPSLCGRILFLLLVKTEMQHSDTDRPLRVLFVNRMAGMIRGGGETFDLEISRALNDLGCETTFLSGRPIFSRPHIELDHPRCVFLRSPWTGWLPRAKIPGGWHIRFWDFKRFEHKAARWAYAQRARFDVIQVCELPFFVARWKNFKTDVPVVMRLTAPDYYDPVGAVLEADAVIASGTTMEKMRSGARPDCADIPNAVDSAHFRPQTSDFRRKHSIGEADPVFLYVARMVPFKRHTWLLDAFTRILPEIPGARLILAGRGPLEEELKNYCLRAGLMDRVIFMGQVAYDRLPSIYAAADVKVIASDERESFCFAALEAMAMGLPLVSTACGMLPSLIGGNEGGRVVAVDDAAGFAKALVAMAADADERRRAGRRNRDYVIANHSWQNSARKLRDLYELL